MHALYLEGDEDVCVPHRIDRPARERYFGFLSVNLAGGKFLAAFSGPFYILADDLLLFGQPPVLVPV